MPTRKKPLVFRKFRRVVGGHHDPEIKLGMARGPWADYWAQAQEEEGRSFSGVDLYEAAPDAPEWAEVWAQKLCEEIVRMNDSTSLDSLYRAAVREGFTKNRETFGFYLAMQSIGHGVAWDDDISGADLKIALPHTEFYET
jgi:hypothetical protein